MLVLGRRQGEQITIGDEIVISIVRTGNGTVRIGVEAPESLVVRRRNPADCSVVRTVAPETSEQVAKTAGVRATR